jgi:hypothetical protein
MADQNQRIDDLLDTLADSDATEIENALRIFEPADVAAVLAQRAVANGGSSSLIDAVAHGAVADYVQPSGGGTGAGTGTDSTAAIMAAIEAAGVAGGGTVWFARGKYLVKTASTSLAALLIAYDNVILDGDPGAEIYSELTSQGCILVAGQAKQTGAYPSSSGNAYTRRTFYKVSAIALGDVTVTFSRSADAALFSPGDIMFIRTGQINGNADQDEPDCETVEVLSVSGSVVTLKEPVAKNYAQEYFASGTATTTAADIAVGATTVTLTSASGFATGDAITIIGSGTDPSHSCKITGTISGSVVTLTQPVTAAIAVGATVTNATAKTTTSSTSYPAVFGAANVTADTLFNVAIRVPVFNRFSTSPAISGAQIRGFSVKVKAGGSKGAFISMGNIRGFDACDNVVHQSPAAAAQAFLVALGPGCKDVRVNGNLASSTAFTGISMSEGTVNFAIDDNVLVSAPSSSTSDSPIAVQTRSGRGSIRNNQIIGGGSDAAIAVAVDCTRGGLIHGNIVRGGNFTKGWNIQSDGWSVGRNDIGALSHSETAATVVDILSRLPGGTTTFLRGDGSFATPPSGSSAAVYRSSDSSAVTASVTLAADDTLKFSIGANEVWFVQVRLIVNAANTAMDIKVGFSGPSGCTASWGAQGNQGSNLQGFGSSTPGSTPLAINSIASTLSLGTLAGTCGQSIDGIFFNGATAGTVTLQWAQNTSDAGALKLLAGSCLILTKLSA